MWSRTMVVLLAGIAARGAPVAAAPEASVPTTAPSMAPATRPAPTTPVDLSTPRAALRSLQLSMQSGDIAAMKKVLHTSNPAEVKMVGAMANLASALAQLHRASLEAYGDEGAKSVTGDTESASTEALARIDAADVAIEGNLATVTYKDAKETPVHLKRIDGHWQIPMSELAEGVEAAKLDQRLAELTVQTQLLAEVTADIDAGRYKTADKAAQAWHSKMLQAATSHPTTGPSALPPEHS